tara:strand:+ start:5948 stop:6451 length:504 start_codon:yes stop_codon:yes gene_type:complete
VQPQTFLFKNDGQIPNNEHLPMLFYAGAFAEGFDPSVIEDTFEANHWGNSWRNGVFPYPHYHTNAHEALACYSGSASIRFGGDAGVVQEVKAGDLVILPAGVGHERLKANWEFAVVGAYPAGQSPDLFRGDSPVSDRELANIGRVPLPELDPAFGDNGLPDHWHAPN